MSNLLEKASILLTPTAYDDGKILSVKPEDGTGDFDFTRNSSATRVNSQGLIEDMQILSGELVSNGNFSQGSQDWSVTGSDANNYVVFNGSTARLKFLNTSPVTQLITSFILTAGKKYKLTVDVATVTSGVIKVDGNGISETFNTPGITTRIINPTGATAIKFYRASANVDITLNSVSLIEITDDTNLPRIDYTGGVGHWLFEPQSTNGLNYSEPTSSETSASGITYELFNWEIGFTNCIKFGDNSQTRYRYFTGTIANSTEYTISAFVIMDDLSEPVLGTSSVNGDLILRVGGNSATTGNLPNVNMGNNIYRLSSVITSSSSGGSTGLLKYTGQSNKGFRIVGFQLEEGSFATSYIPTEGAIKTRLQDAANGAGSSDLINSTEGVLYAEIAALADDLTNRRITISDNSISNRIVLGFADASNTILALVGSSGTQFISTIAISDIKSNNKFALKYKQNDFALWINGFEVATDTSGNTPTGLITLKIQGSTGFSNFYGKVKCVAVFKEALTDAELTCLTTI